MQRNIMPKNDNSSAKIACFIFFHYYYYCNIFINKFEQIEYPLLMFISWSLNRQIFIYENLVFDH